MFNEYIREILAPTLESGDIIVLDNLNVHKSVAARDAIEARHAEIKFLPAYSPDLNPIEKMWSKVKQTLKSMKPRTSPTLTIQIWQ